MYQIINTSWSLCSEASALRRARCRGPEESGQRDGLASFGFVVTPLVVVIVRKVGVRRGGPGYRDTMRN